MNVILRSNEVDWLIRETSPLVSFGQNYYIHDISKE